jgi:3'(2'), 5'-bisphosphate nucleotidase
MPNPEELLNITQNIAQQASDLIISYYNSPADWQITHKGQGEGDVTNADLAANKLILDGLQSACGTEQFAYISEETADDPQRLNYDWVWIIDPLDGTKGFIERSGEFAVHIGLVHHQRPVLGVVAFPESAEMYVALAHQGAFCQCKDGTKKTIATSAKTDLQSMIAIVSRSHRSAAMDYVLEKLPKHEEQHVGGLGGKFMAIATGKVDYYITIPDQSAPKDWDFCAPEIILQEAGGKATYFDGQPLLYNRPDLRQLQPIVASNGKVHQELCQQCLQAFTEFQLKHG